MKLIEITDETALCEICGGGGVRVQVKVTVKVTVGKYIPIGPVSVEIGTGHTLYEQTFTR